MEKNRRQYTKEFKTEAVRLIVEEGRRISEVARELGIAENLLHRWKKKYEEGKIDPFPGKGRCGKFLPHFKGGVDSWKDLRYPAGSKDG